MPKTTISVIKADVGSFPGHSRTHPKLLEKAAKMLKEEEGKILIDSFVTHCGDELVSAPWVQDAASLFAQPQRFTAAHVVLFRLLDGFFGRQ